MELKLLDFLLASFDRATVRGYEAEANALWALYQATATAVLAPEPSSAEHVRTALEGLARVNPRRGRAIRPHFEALLRELEGSRA